MHLSDGLIPLWQAPIYWILIGPLGGVMVAFLCFIVQYFILGMGGITSLGANVVTMGIVMSFSTYYFYKFTAELDDRLSIFSGTFVGIIMATLTQVFIMLAAGVATLEVLMATLVPFYLFVGIVEGIINIFILLPVFKLKPELAQVEKL